MIKIYIGLGLLCSAAFSPLFAQKQYTCLPTNEKITVDGKLQEQAWQRASWTDDFVDIEGDARPRPPLRTRAKMLWDENNFYVFAELQEPHVWARLEVHDSIIYQDNDFEVFIDPDGDARNYFEFEINALNTGWDLFLPKPYREGGKADNRWEIHGLQTAVQVQGKRNDPQGLDAGWTVEMAFPWNSFAHQGYRASPPRQDDIWRVNFSRVEWPSQVVDGKYRKIPKTPENNWVWSPQGAINMHIPQKWGLVCFQNRP